jgi:hypothetical protein
MRMDRGKVISPSLLVAGTKKYLHLLVLENTRQKVVKFYKFDEKRAIIP